MKEKHPLLARQLNKLQLNSRACPSSIDSWQAFLGHVNRAYADADQERYILERSMEVSSREMMDLNQKLEKAQHIARLGHWMYNFKTDHAVWSKELYRILHLEYRDGPPSYEEFMKQVHEEDRPVLHAQLLNANKNSENFSSEFRMIQPDGSYRWYEIIAQSEDAKNQMSGIIMDINEHKEAQETIRRLNQKVLATARQAGMTEVATTMLHNIGNVLNSTNISITVMKETLRKSSLSKLSKINEMLEAHQNDLRHFLKEDEKGKLLFPYLKELDRKLQEESIRLRKELLNTAKRLDHIRDIVQMQQIIGNVSTLIEKIPLDELIKTAIEMTLLSPSCKEIYVHQNLESCPLLATDKSRVLQILVNLLQNAREAVLSENAPEDKTIDISASEPQNGKILICVKDSGEGIPAENLGKVFNFGFTTKKTGNGFGLHGAALSAKDLGGDINVKSEGEGRGTEFILSLPLQYQPRGT